MTQTPANHAGPADARPVVVQTEDLDASAAGWLAERAELVRCRADDRDGLARALARADGLVVRTYTRVDDGLLGLAPRLRVVGRAGVGLDNIDLPTCRARGVRVVYTPDANSSAVAELVTALMLDALRPRVFLDKALPLERWSALRRELTAPRQLEGLTLGVWGLGRVGTRIARVGAALNMRVIYNDLRQIDPQDRAGARPVDADELLASSDVLTIHVDGREENRGLLGGRGMGLLKPDVVLINTSRGFVVHAGALAEFLRAHPSATALLDVHEPEPFGPEHPLLGVPNAHLMPHIGAATAAAHLRMSLVVEDVWRVLSGEEPRYGA